MSRFTSLCLGFFIYKMGMILAPTPGRGGGDMTSRMAVRGPEQGCKSVGSPYRAAFRPSCQRAANLYFCEKFPDLKLLATDVKCISMVQEPNTAHTAEVCIWGRAVSRRPPTAGPNRSFEGGVVLPGEEGNRAERPWNRVGAGREGAHLTLRDARRVPEGEAGIPQGREEALQRGILWEEDPGPQGGRPWSLA